MVQGLGGIGQETGIRPVDDKPPALDAETGVEMFWPWGVGVREPSLFQLWCSVPLITLLCSSC